MALPSQIIQPTQALSPVCLSPASFRPGFDEAFPATQQLDFRSPQPAPAPSPAAEPAQHDEDSPPLAKSPTDASNPGGPAQRPSDSPAAAGAAQGAPIAVGTSGVTVAPTEALVRDSGSGPVARVEPDTAVPQPGGPAAQARTESPPARGSPQQPLRHVGHPSPPPPQLPARPGAAIQAPSCETPAVGPEQQALPPPTSAPAAAGIADAAQAQDQAPRAASSSAPLQSELGGARPADADVPGYEASSPVAGSAPACPVSTKGGSAGAAGIAAASDAAPASQTVLDKTSDESDKCDRSGQSSGSGARKLMLPSHQRDTPAPELLAAAGAAAGSSEGAAKGPSQGAVFSELASAVVQAAAAVAEAACAPPAAPDLAANATTPSRPAARAGVGPGQTMPHPPVQTEAVAATRPDQAEALVLAVPAVKIEPQAAEDTAQRRPSDTTTSADKGGNGSNGSPTTVSGGEQGQRDSTGARSGSRDSGRGRSQLPLVSLQEVQKLLDDLNAGFLTTNEPSVLMTTILLESAKTVLREGLGVARPPMGDATLKGAQLLELRNRIALGLTDVSYSVHSSPRSPTSVVKGLLNRVPDMTTCKLVFGSSQVMVASLAGHPSQTVATTTTPSGPPSTGAKGSNEGDIDTLDDVSDGEAEYYIKQDPKVVSKTPYSAYKQRRSLSVPPEGLSPAARTTPAAGRAAGTPALSPADTPGLLAHIKQEPAASPAAVPMLLPVSPLQQGGQQVAAVAGRGGQQGDQRSLSGAAAAGTGQHASPTAGAAHTVNTSRATGFTSTCSNEQSRLSALAAQLRLPTTSSDSPLRLAVQAANKSPHAQTPASKLRQLAESQAASAGQAGLQPQAEAAAATAGKQRVSADPGGPPVGAAWLEEDVAAAAAAAQRTQLPPAAPSGEQLPPAFELSLRPLSPGQPPCATPDAAAAFNPHAPDPSTTPAAEHTVTPADAAATVGAHDSKQEQEQVRDGHPGACNGLQGADEQDMMLVDVIPATLAPPSQTQPTASMQPPRPPTQRGAAPFPFSQQLMADTQSDPEALPMFGGPVRVGRADVVQDGADADREGQGEGMQQGNELMGPPPAKRMRTPPAYPPQSKVVPVRKTPEQRRAELLAAQQRNAAHLAAVAAAAPGVKSRTSRLTGILTPSLPKQAVSKPQLAAVSPAAPAAAQPDGNKPSSTTPPHAASSGRVSPTRPTSPTRVLLPKPVTSPKPTSLLQSAVGSGRQGSKSPRQAAPCGTPTRSKPADKQPAVQADAAKPKSSPRASPAAQKVSPAKQAQGQKSPQQGGDEYEWVVDESMEEIEPSLAPNNSHNTHATTTQPRSTTQCPQLLCGSLGSPGKRTKKRLLVPDSQAAAGNLQAGPGPSAPAGAQPAAVVASSPKGRGTDGAQGDLVNGGVRTRGQGKVDAPGKGIRGTGSTKPSPRGVRRPHQPGRYAQMAGLDNDTASVDARSASSNSTLEMGVPDSEEEQDTDEPNEEEIITSPGSTDNKLTHTARHASTHRKDGGTTPHPAGATAPGRDAGTNARGKGGGQSDAGRDRRASVSPLANAAQRGSGVHTGHHKGAGVKGAQGGDTNNINNNEDDDYIQLVSDGPGPRRPAQMGVTRTPASAIRAALALLQSPEGAGPSGMVHAAHGGGKAQGAGAAGAAGAGSTPAGGSSKAKATPTGTGNTSSKKKRSQPTDEFEDMYSRAKKRSRLLGLFCGLTFLVTGDLKRDRSSSGGTPGRSFRDELKERITYNGGRMIENLPPVQVPLVKGQEGAGAASPSGRNAPRGTQSPVKDGGAEGFPDIVVSDGPPTCRLLSSIARGAAVMSSSWVIASIRAAKFLEPSAAPRGTTYLTHPPRQHLKDAGPLIGLNAVIAGSVKFCEALGATLVHAGATLLPVTALGIAPQQDGPHAAQPRSGRRWQQHHTPTRSPSHTTPELLTQPEPVHVLVMEEDWLRALEAGVQSLPHGSGAAGDDSTHAGTGKGMKRRGSGAADAGARQEREIGARLAAVRRAALAQRIPIHTRAWVEGVLKRGELPDGFLNGNNNNTTNNANNTGAAGPSAAVVAPAAAAQSAPASNTKRQRITDSAHHPPAQASPARPQQDAADAEMCDHTQGADGDGEGQNEEDGPKAKKGVGGGGSVLLAGLGSSAGSEFSFGMRGQGVVGRGTKGVQMQQGGAALQPGTAAQQQQQQGTRTGSTPARPAAVLHIPDYIVPISGGQGDGNGASPRARRGGPGAAAAAAPAPLHRAGSAQGVAHAAPSLQWLLPESAPPAELPPQPHRTYYPGFILNQETIVRVQDCLELMPMPGETLTRVVRLDSCWSELPTDGEPRWLASVTRFYWPQETVFGMASPSGSPPLLFASQHKEERVSLLSVLRRVTVAQGNSAAGPITASDYLCRYKYDHVSMLLSAL